MRITLESTTELTTKLGIQCRVWQGTTEGGIPIFTFIPRIAVQKDADCSQFEEELIEVPPPSLAGSL